MLDSARVQCPYCFEVVEVTLDPQSAGVMVVDCEVCCNPWELTVRRDAAGELVEIRAERAQ